MLGRIYGVFFSYLPTRERRIAELQLDLFLPDQGGRKLLPAVYANLGQSAMETINLWPIIRDVDRFVSADDSQALALLISPPKGIVALSAHVGNWDLLAAYLGKKGCPCWTIGREPNNQAFQKVLTGLRQGYGIRTIWRSDKAALKRIFMTLRDKQVMGALIDQDTSVSSSISTFFGRPASSPIALINLAKRYDSLIMTCFMFRTGFNKFTIYCSKLDHTKPAAEILQAYNDTLERLIRRYPSQWPWFHRRWRTLAEGKLSAPSYLKYLKNGLSLDGLAAADLSFKD